MWKYIQIVVVRACVRPQILFDIITPNDILDFLVLGRPKSRFDFSLFFLIGKLLISQDFVGFRLIWDFLLLRRAKSHFDCFPSRKSRI